MVQARTSPLRARLQWVRLPVWSVYGLGGLLVGLGLAMPWLAAWQGLLAFEAKGAPTKSQALRPELILLPGGAFDMGGDAATDEKPVHRVTVDSFLMCRTEVTQAQWKAVMGDDPSDCDYGCEDDAPVQHVSWLDAVAYLNRLSTRQSLTPCYEVQGENVAWDEKCDGYRLPTEAEWEYAARAGTTTAYSFDDETRLNEYAWFEDNAGGKVHPVARKQQNPWGFYDMHGNVWEWVWDWYGSYLIGIGIGISIGSISQMRV